MRVKVYKAGHEYFLKFGIRISSAGMSCVCYQRGSGTLGSQTHASGDCYKYEKCENGMAVLFVC